MQLFLEQIGKSVHSIAYVQVFWVSSSPPSQQGMRLAHLQSEPISLSALSGLAVSPTTWGGGGLACGQDDTAGRLPPAEDVQPTPWLEFILPRGQQVLCNICSWGRDS